MPSSLAHSLAGLLAGSFSTALLYPLDLIKIRLQVNESKIIHTQNTSFFSTQFSAEIRTLLRSERDSIAARRLAHPARPRHSIPPFFLKYRALYSGLTPSLLGNGLSWGGYFLVYDATKKLLLSPEKENNTSGDFLLASAASGVTMVLMTNPIWLIKTRMQLQVKSASSSHYTSIPNAFATIAREEGVLALYKGVAPALLLVSHGMIQFNIYEHLKIAFPSNARKPTFDDAAHARPFAKLEDSMGYLLMGALSKVIASTTTYPIQLIKSRMQQRSSGYEVVKGGEGTLRKFKDRTYPSIFTAVHRIHKMEGFSGFFKGAGTNAFRVAPNAAVTFLVYETVCDALT